MCFLALSLLTAAYYDASSWNSFYVARNTVAQLDQHCELLQSARPVSVSCDYNETFGWEVE